MNDTIEKLDKIKYDLSQEKTKLEEEKKKTEKLSQEKAELEDDNRKLTEENGKLAENITIFKQIIAMNCSEDANNLTAIATSGIYCYP